MRRYLLIFSVCQILTLKAQITINNLDMPLSGDTLRMSTTPSIGAIDVTQTGPNYNWDYTALVAQIQDVDTFVSVASTPFAYQFYFNNTYLYPNWKANFAQKVPDLVGGVSAVTITSVYDYYKNNSTQFTRVGFGANINGLPTSVKFDSLDVIYRFPLDFTDTDSSVSRYSVSIPGLGYYGQRLKRVNVVDGWGTLSTPFGTFQVLRVKSSIAQRDTFFSTQYNIGYGVNLPPRIEYKWLAKGMKAPVLQVNAQVSGSNIVVQNAVYRDSVRKDAIQVGIIKENLNEFQGNISPNPGKFDQLKINVENAPMGNKIYFQIMDIAGKTIYSKDMNLLANTEGIYLSDVMDGAILKPGIYVIKGESSSKNSFFHKFVVY